MVERFLDGALGDFMEDDAFDVDVVEQTALLQQLLDMPGNRFPFAIRIGCEV